MADSAYQGDEPYAFVCYAHEDSNVVYAEMAWLREQGINLWYDEGISAGTNWRAAIGDHLLGASHVLFYISKHSLTSDHCNREINLALDEVKNVVPVYLEDVDLTSDLKVGLNRVQAIHRFEIDEKEYRDKLSAALELSPSAPMDQPPPTKRQSWVAPLVALTLIVVVGMGGYVLWRPGASEEPVKVSALAQKLHNSIAVLPFDNLSPDPDNAYFAAGIHEEILNQLAKIKDLSVIARTTMLRYADSDKSVPEIGAELRVNTVMEGSVRYAGNRVRITVQLIDSTSGAQLWSKAYEDSLEDIFGIQLAIATQIASTLEAEFSPAEQTRIGTGPTDNPEAYVLYLRAVSGWGNYSPTGPLHEELDAAIAIDPKFAAALAFKAMIHSIEATAGGNFFPTFGAADQRRFASLALEYAQRALAIDQEQARAHYALRWNHTINREWDASQRSAARAYESNRNDYMVLNSSGWDALARGEVDRGIEYVERSIALNPNDFALQGNFADLLGYSQRWEHMLKQARLVSALAPDWVYPYVLLAQANSFIGDVEGVRNAAAAIEAKIANPYHFGSIAASYARVGDLENSRRTIESARAQGIEDTPRLTFLGVAAEDEAAIEFLERALDTGFPWAVGRDLHYFSNHPNFDSIRAHPKFDELVQRAAFPLVESE